MEQLKAFVRRIDRLLWPERVFCLACRRPSEGEDICPRCRAEMDELRLDDAYTDDPLAFFRSVWKHDGPARMLVLRLKHYGEARAALMLAQGMVKAVAHMELPPDTVLTWVPMPTDRKRDRGIDHGEHLARAIGRELNLPAAPLMRRTRSSLPQVRLNKAKRRTNLQNAFAALSEIRTPVLLVDDVYTTGASVNGCTECLLASGAPWVKAVTATQAVQKEEFISDRGQWKTKKYD